MRKQSQMFFMRSGPYEIDLQDFKLLADAYYGTLSEEQFLHLVENMLDTYFNATYFDSQYEPIVTEEEIT